MGVLLNSTFTGFPDDGRVPFAIGRMAGRERPDPAARRPLAGRAPGATLARVERAVRRGLDALGLARIGGRSWRAHDLARHRRRGDRRPPARRSRAVLDARSADPDDDRLRATRTGRGDGAAAAVRPGNLVPGFLRTRLGQRSRVADHPRRAAWRRVGHQRPEGVDQFRAIRDTLRSAHPDRGGGTPNHEAITAFFVDMDTPGVNVRPLRTMHDVDEFCEVYFDDVVVPADRMLGKPGDGWQLAMDLLPYERSTCFWQRIAYLYSRFDALIGEVKGLGQAADSDLGEAYLALHTLRCRSRATQHRLADGHKLGPDTSIDKVLLAGAEQQLYDTARDLLPGVIELDDTEWRTEYLYSRAATIYGGTAEVQRNIIARRLLDLGKE